MTREQKLFRGLIKADLKLVAAHYEDEDKAVRLQAAYHLQQAVEKTIKWKAELAGLNLWGHDIDILLKQCDDASIDIGVPKYIRDRADMITHWEAECRYYPTKVVRKDTLKKVYEHTVQWFSQEK